MAKPNTVQQEEGAVGTPTRLLSEEQHRWLTDLYLANFPRVYRVCLRILRNPDDAADAAHEVFLRAVGSYQPRPGEEVGAWLMTVARNYSLDILRRRKRLGRLMVTLSGDRSEGADPAASVMDRQLVAAVFEQLRERERLALWQSAVEHRSLSAIAADLRLSYMATAQLLYRARRHAAALAAKLAAIFGLLQLGRMLRRLNVSGSRVASRANQPSAGGLTVQHLIAIAAVPLVVAAVSPSSSVSPPWSLPSVAPPASGSPLNLVPNTGPLQVPGLNGVHVPQIKALPSMPPLPSVLPSLPVPPPVSVPTPPPLPIPSSVSSAANSVQQTLQQLSPSAPIVTPGPLGRHQL